MHERALVQRAGHRSLREIAEPVQVSVDGLGSPVIERDDDSDERVGHCVPPRLELDGEVSRVQADRPQLAGGAVGAPYTSLEQWLEGLRDLAARQKRADAPMQ